MDSKVSCRLLQFSYFVFNFVSTLLLSSLDRHSSVGIATGYGMDGPGIESQWGRDFPNLSWSSLGSNQPLVQ